MIPKLMMRRLKEVQADAVQMIKIYDEMGEIEAMDKFAVLAETLQKAVEELERILK